MKFPNPTPRRPAFLDHQQVANMAGGVDPARRTEVAHTTAAALVTQGRARAVDSELVQRLVALVDEQGIDEIAELWADAAPETLPGALWRLYMLRETARTQTATLARLWEQGLGATEVAQSVAGLGPGDVAEEIVVLFDRVVGGVFAGDLDVALDRASAFCQIIAAGSAELAGSADLIGGPELASQLIHDGEVMAQRAGELRAAAAAWRAGRLD